MFALIDCNNFYVSCERVFQPELEAKAGCVLSNNDGCAIARSQEAKDLGVKMGSPYFEIQKMVEEKRLWWRSSNYPLYQDMMRRVTAIIKEYFPEQEIYSIDECFCDLSQYKIHDVEKLAIELRSRVFQYTGIPVCIGISSTKTLAKVANKIAKKHFKAIGVYHLNTDYKIKKALKNTEIDEVWGIGPRNAIKLISIGVETALDFVALPGDYVQDKFTITGLRTWNELQGLSCIPMEYIPPLKKGIGTGRSFGKFETDLQPMQEALANYVSNAAIKLRAQKSICAKIFVYAQTSRYAVNNKIYAGGLEMKLPSPTNLTSELIGLASSLLTRIYKKGYYYQKVGVELSDIRPENEMQISLFDDKGEELRTRLAKANKILDKINTSYGRDTIQFAQMGTTKKWKMRQEFLSKKFTTSLNDVIVVKAK